MDAGVPLSLDGFRPLLDEESVVRALTEVRADVDGEQVGPIPITTLQEQLVAEADFAILELEAPFSCPVKLSGLEVEVNATGLRTLELDGAYCVPSKRDMAEDREGYVLPDDLAVGDHRLTWSYAWNPPEEPEGVSLVAPRILGLGGCIGDVDIPEGATCLLLEGPRGDQLEVELDGARLPVSEGNPVRVGLPPGTSGSAVLTFRFHEDGDPLRSGRWLR